MTTPEPAPVETLPTEQLIAELERRKVLTEEIREGRGTGILATRRRLRTEWEKA